MKVSTQTLMVGAVALGVVAFGLYVAKKGVTDATAGAVGVVGDVVADVGAGVVLGVGDVIGIPRTNETECEKAKREGRTWDASFACPALDFIGHAWGELWGSESGATGSW